MDPTILLAEGESAAGPGRSYAEEQLGSEVAVRPDGHEASSFSCQANDPCVAQPTLAESSIAPSTGLSECSIRARGGFGVAGPIQVVWGLIVSERPGRVVGGGRVGVGLIARS